MTMRLSSIRRLTCEACGKPETASHPRQRFCMACSLKNAATRKRAAEKRRAAR